MLNNHTHSLNYKTICTAGHDVEKKDALQAWRGLLPTLEDIDVGALEINKATLIPRATSSLVITTSFCNWDSNR